MTAHTGISSILRIITLVISLITISVSIFEYGIQNRIEEELARAQDAEKTNHRKSDNDHGIFYLPDYQATISSFQIHMEQSPVNMETVPVLLFIRIWHHKNLSISELDFFKTLFQHIISPNAP